MELNLLQNPLFVQIICFITITLYATIGALIFSYSEHREPSSNSRAYSIPNLNENNRGQCVKSLIDWVRIQNVKDQHVELYIAYCFRIFHQEEEAPDWSFPSALLFTFTVITTIGYGHVSPTSVFGRVFFMFYAFIGIPLTLIYFANIGKYMKEAVIRLSKKIYIFYKIKRKKEIIVPVSAPFITAFLLYTFLGGVMFCMIENDTDDILTGVYFVFVTLTTIGFGDIYPKNSPFLWLSLIYIAVGIALNSIAIDIMSNYLRMLHHLGRKLAKLSEARVWIGDQETTVENLIGSFADTHGIARPTESEIENLVEAAVAETKNVETVDESEMATPEMEMEHDRVPELQTKRKEFKRSRRKPSIFDIDKSLVKKKPIQFGEIGYKHDPKMRYEQFEREWAKQSKKIKYDKPTENTDVPVSNETQTTPKMESSRLIDQKDKEKSQSYSSLKPTKPPAAGSGELENIKITKD